MKQPTLWLTLALVSLLLWWTLSAPPPAPTQSATPLADESRWFCTQGSPSLQGQARTSLAADPALLWSCELEGNVSPQPLIGEGRVVVLADRIGAVALDLSRGTRLWSRPLAGAFFSGAPYLGREALYVGDEKGSLHALNPTTGAVLWSNRFAQCIKAGINGDAERIFVGCYDQHLYALSRSSGEILWKFAIEEPVHATPVLTAEGVWITGCDGWLRCLDPQRGEGRLALEVTGHIGSSPASAEGWYVFGTHEGEVIAVREGEIRWRTEKRYRTAFDRTPALTGKALFIQGEDGVLRSLDLASGAERWSLPIPDSGAGSPALADRNVWIGGGNGVLYALEQETGAIVWQREVGGDLSPGLAIAQGRLVAVTADGGVFCFGTR